VHTKIKYQPETALKRRQNSFFCKQKSHLKRRRRSKLVRTVVNKAKTQKRNKILANES